MGEETLHELLVVKLCTICSNAQRQCKGQLAGITVLTVKFEQSHLYWLKVIVNKLIWLVCGRYVVGMRLICGRYVVGKNSAVVSMWSVKSDPWSVNQINLFTITLTECCNYRFQSAAWFQGSVCVLYFPLWPLTLTTFSTHCFLPCTSIGATIFVMHVTTVYQGNCLS